MWDENDLNQLPSPQRAVFQLVIIDDKTISMVSDELGLLPYKVFDLYQKALLSLDVILRRKAAKGRNILQHIRKLPKPQGQVAYSIIFELLSIHETAARLGHSPRQVMEWYKQAIKSLKDHGLEP